MYVDFNHVDQKHAEIHKRLENWARWCVTNTRGFVSPIFRLYRATEVWDHEQGQLLPPPIDPMDAQRMEKAVSKLPEKHRDAIRWCYIVRAQPVRMCRALGVSKAGLVDMIHEGRTMLVNRGA